VLIEVVVVVLFVRLVGEVIVECELYLFLGLVDVLVDDRWVSCVKFACCAEFSNFYGGVFELLAHLRTLGR